MCHFSSNCTIDENALTLFHPFFTNSHSWSLASSTCNKALLYDKQSQSHIVFQCSISYWPILNHNISVSLVRMSTGSLFDICFNRTLYFSMGISLLFLLRCLLLSLHVALLLCHVRPSHAAGFETFPC